MPNRKCRRRSLIPANWMTPTHPTPCATRVGMGRLNLAMVLMMMVIVSVTAGCQTNKTDDFAPVPALMESNDVAAIGYHVRWLTSLGLPASQQLAWTVILDDLIITAESPDNVVTAIALRDGRVRWRQLVGLPGDRIYRPVLLGTQLLINTGTTFYALDTDSGHIEYAHELNQVVQTSPVLIDKNTLVYGAMTGRVYGLGVKSGFQNWAYQMSAGITADPVAVNERVFIADQSGIYAMFDGGSGELLWKGRAFERVVADPAVDGSTVYMASQDRSLYALDSRSGRDKWVYRTTTPLTDSPIVLDTEGDTIYLPIPFQALVAIDTSNGRERWRLPAAVRPVARQGQRIVAYDKNNVHLIDAESGKSIRAVPMQDVTEILRGPDGKLLVVSNLGEMMLIAPGQ